MMTTLIKRIMLNSDDEETVIAYMRYDGPSTEYVPHGDTHVALYQGEDDDLVTFDIEELDELISALTEIRDAAK